MQAISRVLGWQVRGGLEKVFLAHIAFCVMPKALLYVGKERVPWMAVLTSLNSAICPTPHPDERSPFPCVQSLPLTGCDCQPLPPATNAAPKPLLGTETHSRQEGAGGRQLQWHPYFLLFCLSPEAPLQSPFCFSCTRQ